MQVPFFDLKLINDRYLDLFEHRIVSVAQSPTTILGPRVKAFEQTWAQYCGARWCVGVGNGYDAMRIMLRVFGIGRHHRVVVASNTHIATWLAVLAEGASIVVAEPNTNTMVLDATSIAQVKGKVDAVLATQLYGAPVDTTTLKRAAGGVPVFLDAAQGHGLKDYGTAAAYSFYPTKNLGALGDGGAIVCDNITAQDTMRHYRNYGAREQNHHDFIGINSRLDELQAAILSVKLNDLDSDNERRKEIAHYYDASFADLPLRLPPMRGVFHQYVVRHMNRDTFRAKLAERGVQTLIHYPTPPHLQPAMVGLGFNQGDFPVAERMAKECLSLPVGPQLTDEQVEYVVQAVQESV